jgi:hypothetical protein
VAAGVEQVAATVRAFAARSGARRVVLLLDRGDPAAPAMLECAADGTLELTEGGRTSRVSAETSATPLPLPEIRPAPASALFLDPDTGELEAPLGAISNMARAVLGLARAAGGRSVATAEFATRVADVDLTIAAREGEPLVVAAGDRRFQFPEEALGR